MNVKNNEDISRMTIDIPKKFHKQLKTLSALLGKSMREIVTESIENHLKNAKMPNKETIKAIKDFESGKGLKRAKNAEDLFKKLGI
jgi:predicted DNA-binding protein